jgi:hypothetical protein
MSELLTTSLKNILVIKYTDALFEGAAKGDRTGVSQHNLSKRNINSNSLSNLKSSIFWDITPCSPLKVNGRFRGTCRLHFQGRRVSQARKQREAELSLLTAVFMLVSCVAYSSTLKMCLRNVGCLSTDYMAIYPRRQNSS